MSLIRPTLRAAQRSASASFHTYPAAALRVTRDRNPDRGVSPLHRRGQKDPLGAAKYGLPEPVLDMERHTKVVTADDHGMWGFFRNKSGLPTPEENHKHGRHWTVEELRHKSWEDLHKLWWTCVKERNIIETQVLEHKRLKPGYGEHESNERKLAVRWTQRGIKHVLTERHYAWEEARQLAQQDQEVDLSGEGAAYQPGRMLEDEEPEVPGRKSEA